MRIALYELEQNKGLPYIALVKTVNYSSKNKLDAPSNINHMMCDVFSLQRKANEHFYLLALNNKLKLNAVFCVSIGTVNASLVDSRDIGIRLLLSGATSFVAVHNHPSGDIMPSKEDYDVTYKIIDLGKLLGINCLDHIIVGGHDYNYYSFREDNEIKF